jgi:TolA-binding protein
MARLRVFVMLAIAGTSGSAAAQHARYPRAQPAPDPVTLSERVAPLVAKAATASTPMKPSIDIDMVLSIEGLRGAIRSEQEQILAELINNTPDSEVEEKSDYYFRLGELYAKQHRMWLQKSADAVAAGKQQDASSSANMAKTYLLKTVKTFKGLTDTETFRSYPKMDLALFYYAYTLQKGKYLKEARAVYDKLLKNHPHSKYVPEAHFAFAEHYVDQGQLADAESRYKKLLEFPKSTVYPYALHRLGWVYVKLAKPKEAMELFAKVVSATRGDIKLELLYKAAKNDFVSAYVSAGKPEQAFATFQSLSSKDAVDLLELFGEAAWSGGAADRVAVAYRDLLSRVPNDARACAWQYRISRATSSMQNATRGDKVKQIDALVHRVGPSADDECRENASAMSAELAASYFVEWSKTKNDEALAYAEQLYSIHVTAFPDHEDQRAQYAEVLWARADRESNVKTRRQRWQRAAETFTSIDARAAALAWMNALDIEMPADAKVKLAKPARMAARAQKLPADAVKLVAAVSTYIEEQPGDDAELAQMRLAVAMTLRRYRHFDEAVAVLDSYLEHHQSDARAELAANLLLDSLIQRGKPDETLEVVAAIMADRSFVDGKPELTRNLTALRTQLLGLASRR